uniref:G_PROTEIN_RECEP_F1_2 domain-containing protein n=1 Tax=Caenorhabditis tropicalis TaxID=1561998 RepID=A0A1I7TW21_9PELO
MSNQSSTIMSNLSGNSCEVKLLIELQTSIFLHGSEILMLILSVIVFPLLFIMMEKCLRKSFFHVNIRIISVVLCLSLLAHCVGRIVQHTTDIYFWIATIPICDKRQYVQLCMVFRGMYLFGMYCSSFTSVTLVIERTIATYLSQKYENRKAKIGVMIVAAQILLSTAITVIFLRSANLPDRPDYCFFRTPSNDWAVSLDVLSLSLNAIALFQGFRLNNINIKLRSTVIVSHLSQKYQIEENKTLIRVILRFICIDFFFMVCYFLLTFISDFNQKSLSFSSTLAYFELIHCVPVYAIVMMIAMPKTIKKIQQENTQKLGDHVRVNDDAYLPYLKKQWLTR